MTDLVPANDATLATIDQKIHYSKTISASNLLPEAYRGRPENVLIAVETGAALGIPAIQALNSINVIKGKAAMSADLMASLVRRAGHKLRITQEGMSVTAELVRADDPDFTFSATWDQKKAQTAGLWGKGNWATYPDQMLRARAITEVCRQGASDALMGVIYTPEELQDTTPAPAPVARGNDLRSRIKPNPKPETPSADRSPEPARGEASVTHAQLKKIHAAFNELGATAKPVKQQTYRYVLKRDVESSTDLTKSEAHRVIDYLESRIAETAIVDAEIVEGQEPFTIDDEEEGGRDV